MICAFCHTDTVTWRGPLSALTHTQCSTCGRQNCQQVTELEADEDDAPRRSPKIITTHVYPPIPMRCFDWQAHYAGEEDELMATGHGASEAAAVLDLIENHPRPDVFCTERGTP